MENYKDDLIDAFTDMMYRWVNLKNKWFTIKVQLVIGMHANSQMQKDWKKLGSEAFNYEVLEEKEADEVTDMRWELK
ncbi:MAG: hypothetical protein ABFC94_14725 [Syntrophomonas sp.]